MRYQDKTKEQPTSELVNLTKRSTDFKTLQTEYKCAVDALRESEKQYRSLFQNSKDATLINIPQGKLADVNQAALVLFGYQREEMRGLDVREIFADRETQRTYEQALEDKGFVRGYGLWLRKKDGFEM